MASECGSRLSFGRFILDPRTHELFADGSRVPLQQQPARVLALLLSRAGECVTRAEIQDYVWGSERVVDYGQSINFCIARIRTALDEAAAGPLIETLPRRGYRWIGPIAQRVVTPTRPNRARFSGARRWARAAVVAGLVAATPFVLHAFAPSSETGRAHHEAALSALRTLWAVTASHLSGTPQ